jgi:phage minor structural protein
LGDRVLDKTYYFFSPAAIEGIADAEEFKPDETLKELAYTKYKPMYNEGAQKVRSVTAKESNYFNILQSIAETFGAWLKLKIVRDSSGGITKKEVEFKNYSGQNNYAGFKYGINLKGI